MTIRELAERWYALKQETLRDKTLKQYRYALDRWIVPRFGDREVADIGTRDCLDFLDAMRAVDMSHSVANAYYGCLSGVLSEAVFQGLVDRNPAFDARRAYFQNRKFKKSVQAAPFYFEELPRLMDAFIDRPRVYNLMMLMAYTGLRPSEAAAVRPEHFEDGKSPRLYVPDSKTAAGERFVPVDPGSKLYEVLRVQKAQLVLDRKRGQLSPWMFPTSTGSQYSTNALARYFQRGRVAAGFPEESPVLGAPYRQYSLRASFAVMCLEADIPVETVQKWMGHESQEMTLRYARWRRPKASKMAAVSALAC